MKLKFLYNGVIVPLSILIPIVFGVLSWKKAAIGPRLLLLYLIISGLINLSGIIMVTVIKQSNLPLLHLYTIVEAVFILSYFRTIFIDPIIKKALLISAVLFPILCILNFTFLQSINTFNTHTRPLEAILITFFCLLYFYKSGFTENWLQKPINWFNAGILIYFPVACVIFILSNYLAVIGMNKTMNTIVWAVHNTLVLIMYLMWAKGFSLIKNGR
jgi:hypothetical protein